MAILKIWNGSTWVEIPVEDPTLYLLLSGARAMTGPLNMGGNAIVTVSTVDGRDVAADGAVLDTAALLPGRAGGQTLQGGTASGEDLELESTAHATKNEIISKDEHKFVKTAYYSALKDKGNVNGAITLDLSEQVNVHKMTLTGDVTSLAITNPAGPGTYKIWIHQNGANEYTIDAWDAEVDWGSPGSVPAVAIGDEAITLVLLEYNGVDLFLGHMLTGRDGDGFDLA